MNTRWFRINREHSNYEMQYFETQYCDILADAFYCIFWTERCIHTHFGWLILGRRMQEKHYTGHLT
jgi:hypothetical protein